MTLGSCKFCSAPAERVLPVVGKLEFRVCAAHDQFVRDAGRLAAHGAARAAGEYVAHKAPNAMRVGAVVFSAIRAAMNPNGGTE